MIRILVIFLMFSVNAFALDGVNVVPENQDSKTSVVQINDEMRKTTRRVMALEGGLGLDGSLITGILPIEKGGTGQDFSSVPANNVPYFSSTGVMGNIGIGTTGYVLTAGSPPSWQSKNTGVPVILKWGQIDSSTSSNVGIGTSGGILGNTSDLLAPLNGYVYWIFNNTSYEDIFQKDPVVFRKEISTNTISGTFYLWEQSGGAGGGGGRRVSCYVDIGGQVSSTSTSQSATPTSKSWSVDVSGLTVGTNYTIKLMCRDDVQGGNGTVGYVAKMAGYPN
jgi:hypothetical protein